MDVNVKGAYLFAKHSLPLMQKGAKIINMSSVSGVFASPFRSLYCFSKSALLMMSLCQRMELETCGIDVCAICPGEVKTNFMKKRVRVLDTNERYGKRVENAFKFMDKHDEGKRMKPEKIAKETDLSNYPYGKMTDLKVAENIMKELNDAISATVTDEMENILENSNKVSNSLIIKS